jgi:uncharacterized phage-associated protein
MRTSTLHTERSRSKGIPEVADLLQSLVVYTVYKAPYRQSTAKIHKLLYLADLVHYERYRRTVTGKEFLSWHYGPWSPDVQGAILGLEEKEILSIQPKRTRWGKEARVPQPKAKKVRVRLPDDLEGTLGEVLKKWGAESPQVIMAYARSTLPYLLAEDGDRIDLTVLDSPKVVKRKLEALRRRLEKKVGREPRARRGPIASETDPLFYETAPLRRSATEAILGGSGADEGT